MVPPGDGLEFHGTPYYEKIAEHYPELDIAIRAAIRNRPQAGQVLVGTLREWLFSFEGKDYVLFFTRKGAAVGLTAVMDAHHAARIDAKREYLKQTFAKGGLR